MKVRSADFVVFIYYIWLLRCICEAQMKLGRLFGVYNWYRFFHGKESNEREEAWINIPQNITLTLSSTSNSRPAGSRITRPGGWGMGEGGTEEKETLIHSVYIWHTGRQSLTSAHLLFGSICFCKHYIFRGHIVRHTYFISAPWSCTIVSKPSFMAWWCSG